MAGANAACAISTCDAIRYGTLSLMARAATHAGAADHDDAATQYGVAAHDGMSSYTRCRSCPRWHEQLHTLAQLPMDESVLSLFDELDDAFISELVDEPRDTQRRGLQEGHDLLGRVGS